MSKLASHGLTESLKVADCKSQATSDAVEAFFDRLAGSAGLIFVSTCRAALWHGRSAAKFQLNIKYNNLRSFWLEMKLVRLTLCGIRSHRRASIQRAGNGLWVEANHDETLIHSFQRAHDRGRRNSRSHLGTAVGMARIGTAHQPVRTGV